MNVDSDLMNELQDCFHSANLTGPQQCVLVKKALVEWLRREAVKYPLYSLGHYRFQYVADELERNK